MAYKSLYRKYRPLEFKDVFGQDIIIKTLKNSIKEDKINHAYLFAGTRGTGKTTVAKIFAKTINCLSLENGETCNKCIICKTINSDEIQDIIEIDAASNNGVDEIRELKSKINLVPTLCKYKVYIIDEVHMLSAGAFNALLKTLEEPPAHAIFILATTEPQKVPNTILSRCQRYDFKKIMPEDIKKRIKYISDKEKIAVEEAVLDEISKICDGSMRDAIGILEQASSYTNKKIKIKDIYDVTGTISNDKIANLVKYISNKDIEKIMDFVEEMKSEGKDFSKLAEDLMLFLRNVLLNKKAPNFFKKKMLYDKEIIFEISNILQEKELLIIVKEINNLLFDIKKTANASTMFELFLFRIISDGEEKEIVETNTKKIEQNIEKEKEVKEKPQVEIKKVEKPLSKEEISEIFNKKQILINNTLYHADKENLKNAKEKMSNLQTFLINKKFKEASTILLDSKINAAGKNHLLLTYKYQSMVNSHDQEKQKIELLLKELIGNKVKTVAITLDEWEKIRPKYLEMKKNNELIEIKEETIDDNKEETKKQENNLSKNALNDFGNEIVEMEE